jgi:hypothetical protein
MKGSNVPILNGYRFHGAHQITRMHEGSEPGQITDLGQMGTMKGIQVCHGEEGVYAGT